jgi:uncharacterized protein
VKILILLFISLFLYADNFNDGLKEYKSKNYKEAFTEFKKCEADGGCQAMIALMYQNGEGIPKDINKAIKWFEKSANKNEISSQHNLGVIYLNLKKYDKALVWFKKAAKDGMGYTPSIYNIGLIYLYGWGVKSNYSLSLKYMKLAKKLGYTQAKI